MWTSQLLVAVAMAGPPKLPPLPGKDAPPPEPTTPSQPEPSKPTPGKPTTSSKPTATTPSTATPSSPSSTTPPPASGGSKLPGAPTETSGDLVIAPPPPGTPEPTDTQGAPQPTPSAPPPRPFRNGPGAAPAMDGSTPGTDLEPAPAPKMPPPLRPPYRGIGLFIGAGVTFTVALTEQIVGHVLIKRRCIDPVARESMMVDDVDAAEELGNAIVRCLPGVVPAMALRINSDLALLATIGMTTAGAMLRAERQAFDDAFALKKQRNIVALRGAGIGLIAGGVITYFTLGPAAWGILGNCGTARCAGRARAMAFISRDFGAVLAAAGAGMLGFAEAYRRKHELFAREKAISIAPQIGRGFAGIGMSGKF